MKNSVLEELAGTWSVMAEMEEDSKPGRRATLRECADTLLMLVTARDAQPIGHAVHTDVATAVTAIAQRLQAAEAERDRLIAEVARQVEARDAVAAAEYRLIGELCAMQRDRDRLRDALIACRPAVLRDFDRYRMMMPTDEAKRIAALLDTIDAAAKGQ